MEAIEEIEILLVEDNPTDAELSMRALKRGGLANKLLWVKDGQEALDYLFRHGEFSSRSQANPKIVLLDLKMPKLDGIQVLKAIRADEKTKHLPVVIMTSSQEEQDIAKSYALGVNSYVVKPVAFGDMTELVRQAGYYWLAINKTPSS